MKKIKKFLKSCTAYYDSNTGKIHNCDYGSLPYFHECGHKRQMENKFIYTVWNWLPSFTGVLGMFSTYMWITDKKVEWLLLGGLFIIPISAFLLFLELDAWVYAIRQKLKNKRGRF